MKVLATLILAAVVSGCAHTSLRRASVGDQAYSATFQITHHRLLWGLVPITKPAAYEHLCAPAQWAKIETLIRGPQIPFHVLTLGIYSPWTLQVSCAKQ